MHELKSVSENTPFIIEEIKDSNLKSRFYDMGIYPNQTIEVIRRTPFGDPIIVEVGGSLIMLRSDEADLIVIRK